MSALPPDIAARVRGFAIDSRKVAPGFVFGAFPGSKANGESFIPAAIAKGAVAIVARPEAPVAGAYHLKTATPRAAFARLAAAHFAPFPARTAAVTGTNGKTSTVELARQMWCALGHDAASMGTLGVVVSTAGADNAIDTGGRTTPDIVTFLETAHALQQAGVTHLAFEASSHGLDQHRSEGLPVAAAAFTNLTRDHLDYHKTMDAYFAAKLRLFTEVLDPDGTVIVWDDRAADGAAFNARVAEAARSRGLRVETVGPDGAFLRLLSLTPDAHGQTLRLVAAGTEHRVHLPLIGGYQAANALTAAALVAATDDAPVADILALFPRLTGVRGRLERAVTTAAGAPVYIDYAHTPAGLEAALAALRPHTAGRIVLVFGCGGDRDHGKRPQMGAVAAAEADIAIVTDDNPRSEDPAAIRAAIMAGAPGATEVAGRRAAIAAAMQQARRGDIVLVAGKGHEEGQIIGDKVIPFNDADVARTIAAEEAA